jgi:hypothetical protein
MTNSTASIATLSPVEIDTEIARIWGDIDRLDGRIQATRVSLARVHSFGPAKGSLVYPEGGQERERMLQDLEALKAARRALEEEYAPYDREYFVRGCWNRYFLVNNANGHVHSSMGCSTCFATTTYTWLVSLAAQPVAEMIEEWGEKACTVCFPDAPTHPRFHQPSRQDQAAKAQRDAEKAEREAAKASKVITNDDGTPLRSRYGIIATKVAARNELSGAFQDLVNYGPDHSNDYQGYIARLVTALDAAGVEWVPTAEKAIKKALKEASQPIPANLRGFVTEQDRQDSIAEAQANAQVAQALLETFKG